MCVLCLTFVFCLTFVRALAYNIFAFCSFNFCYLSVFKFCLTVYLCPHITFVLWHHLTFRLFSCLEYVLPSKPLLNPSPWLLFFVCASYFFLCPCFVLFSLSVFCILLYFAIQSPRTSLGFCCCCCCFVSISMLKINSLLAFAQSNFNYKSLLSSVLRFCCVLNYVCASLSMLSLLL